MLRGEIDIAVHSMKDVPPIFPEGLALRCITAREDCRDIVILRPGVSSWSELPRITSYNVCYTKLLRGFSSAALPEEADRLYRFYVDCLRQRGMTVATGIFQAEMAVELVNDGPVTLLLDSRREF